MGGAGLTQATRVAILNANYLVTRLLKAYPILFRGRGGWVAHECILDTRVFARHGVSVDDIAKRLVDHAHDKISVGKLSPFLVNADENIIYNIDRKF